MAAELTDAQRAFLQNPYYGTLTTLRKDGSPHTTVVWVDVDEEGVSVNTAHGRAKPRHVAHDQRLSLAVFNPQNPYEWLIVTGTGALSDEGAEDQIDNLAQKYLGQFPYPWRTPDERRVSIRITPERIEQMGIDE